ncbi:hypothetical protein D3C71_189830 [compost metagenome]
MIVGVGLPVLGYRSSRRRHDLGGLFGPACRNRYPEHVDPPGSVRLERRWHAYGRFLPWGGDGNREFGRGGGGGSRKHRIGSGADGMEHSVDLGGDRHSRQIHDGSGMALAKCGDRRLHRRILGVRRLLDEVQRLGKHLAGACGESFDTAQNVRDWRRWTCHRAIGWGYRATAALRKDPRSDGRPRAE